MKNCKYCGKENNNGTKFCTRKCRIAQIKKHQIKGAKKLFKYKEPLGFYVPFDYEGNHINL
jgi:uncharacterized membrane protein YvbJ